MHFKSVSTILLLPVALGACSTGKSYPSLAMRDVERPSGTATPAPQASDSTAPIPRPVIGDLSARIAALVANAREAHQSFVRQQSATERAVAGAGSSQSKSWGAAQISLAELHSSRSGAVTALADLDTLYVEARAADPEKVSPSAAAIEEARTTVGSMVAQEDAVLKQLDARMRT